MFDDLIEMSCLADKIEIEQVALKCKKAANLAEANLAAVRLATANKMMAQAGVTPEEVAEAKAQLGLDND